MKYRIGLNNSKIIIICYSIIGAFIGLSFLYISYFPIRWKVSFVFIIAFFSLALSSGYFKHFFLALLSLSVPFFITNSLGPPPELIHRGGANLGFYNTLWDFPLVMLYIHWIWQIINRGEINIRISKIDILLSAFLLISLFSVVKSEHIGFSFFEIIRLARVSLIYFYIANNIKTNNDIKIIITFLMIALLIESLLGISQYWFKKSFGLSRFGELEEVMSQTLESKTFSRIGGTLGHPNAYAMFLGILLPLPLILLFWKSNFNTKLYYLFIFVTSVIAMVHTLSRGGWINLIVGISTVMFISVFKHIVNKKIIIGSSTLIAIILLLIGVLFSKAIFLRITRPVEAASSNRIDQINMSLAIIKSHPLLGIGINNFTEVMHKYDKTGISSRYEHPVHNLYLLIASEIGITGLMLFLYIILIIFRIGYKSINISDGFIKFISVGILGGISGLLMHSMLDYAFKHDVMLLLFYLYVGLLVAISRINQIDSKIKA